MRDKTAAVVIDAWKLNVFKRHLDAAGYAYTEGPGLTHDTLILSVKYAWARELTPVIEAASKECRERRESDVI